MEWVAQARQRGHCSSPFLAHDGRVLFIIVNESFVLAFLAHARHPELLDAKTVNEILALDLVASTRSTFGNLAKPMIDKKIIHRYSW